MTPEEMAELQAMILKGAEIIEVRLANSLNNALEGINSKIDAGAAAVDELQSKTKTALEAMPHLIKEHVEGSLQANLNDIVEKVGSQFEERMKAQAGGTGAEGANGGGLSLNSLLQHSDKLVSVVNAFRAPTTEVAMLSQMNFVMKWHSLLTKLEKGGGSGDEFSKAIADTFTPKEE